MAEDVSVGWKIAAGLLALTLPIGALILLSTPNRDSQVPTSRFRRRNPTSRVVVAKEAYADKVRSAMTDIWQGVLDTIGTEDRYPWHPVPIARVRKIWDVFSQTGMVRDEYGLERITQELVGKIAAIDAITILSGHTKTDPKKLIQELGFDPPSKAERDHFEWYTSDENGEFRWSDYGIGPLRDLSIQALAVSTPEDKLVLIDRMFNVVHQRTNLSEWLIEGGRDALSGLSDG